MEEELARLLKESTEQGLGGPIPNGGILIQDRDAWDALHDGDQIFLHDKKTKGKAHRHASGKLVKVEKRWWDQEMGVGCLVYWFIQGPMPASEA